MEESEVKEVMEMENIVAEMVANYRNTGGTAVFQIQDSLYHLHTWAVAGDVLVPPALLLKPSTAFAGSCVPLRLSNGGNEALLQIASRVTDCSISIANLKGSKPSIYCHTCLTCSSFAG